MTKLDSRLLSLRVASDVAELLERQAKRERRSKTAVLEWLIRAYCSGVGADNGAYRGALIRVRDFVTSELEGVDNDNR